MKNHKEWIWKICLHCPEYIFPFLVLAYRSQRFFRGSQWTREGVCQDAFQTDIWGPW